jgi:hypothetical protein
MVFGRVAGWYWRFWCCHLVYTNSQLFGNDYRLTNGYNKRVKYNFDLHKFWYLYGMKE